jgi:hypothetical protein
MPKLQYSIIHCASEIILKSSPQELSPCLLDRSFSFATVAGKNLNSASEFRPRR